MTLLRWALILWLIIFSLNSPIILCISPDSILLRICFLVNGFLLLVMSQQVLQRTLSTTMPWEIDDRWSKAQLCRLVKRLLNASRGFVSPQWVQVFVLLDNCPPFISMVADYLPPCKPYSSTVKHRCNLPIYENWRTFRLKFFFSLAGIHFFSNLLLDDNNLYLYI